MRPRHPGDGDLASWAVPRRVAASAGAGGSGQVSTGACQAPQTTATRRRPRLTAARIVLPHVRLTPGLRQRLDRVRLRQRRSAARPSPRSAPGTARTRRAGTPPRRPTSARRRRSPPPRPARPSGSRRTTRRGLARRSRSRPRQHRHRADRDSAGRDSGGSAASGASVCAGRQVAEADRDVVARSAQVSACHSGEKTANGQNAAARRLQRRVRQQRHRRLHARRGGPADQRVRVGGTLDQHRSGPNSRQRGHQRPGRAGAVVADAEHRRPSHLGATGTDAVIDAQDTSRQAL